MPQKAWTKPSPTFPTKTSSRWLARWLSLNRWRPAKSSSFSHRQRSSVCRRAFRPLPCHTRQGRLWFEVGGLPDWDGEPLQFRLLSDGLLGYMWPKWIRAGERSEIRIHSTEQCQLTLWRYG